MLGTAKGAGVSPGCRGQLRLGAGVSSEWVPGTARGAGWAQGTAGAGCWDSPWRPPGPGRRKPPVTAGAGVLARRGGFGVTGRAPGAGQRQGRPQPGAPRAARGPRRGTGGGKMAPKGKGSGKAGKGERGPAGSGAARPGRARGEGRAGLRALCSQAGAAAAAAARAKPRARREAAAP